MFSAVAATLRAQCTSRVQLTSRTVQCLHLRNKVTVSNSPYRVPQPVYDNAVIKRRAFKGKTLQLVALDTGHAPDLWAASGKGSAIMGEFLPGKFPATPLQFNYYIRDLTIVNDDPFSRGVNFCIRNTLESDLPIGVISIRNISSLNKTLEIGFIWIDKELWGTHINLESHYILMEETFEFLRFNRVGFTVDATDTRYQKFLEGIGAKREGVLRSFQIGPDDKPRDAIIYSVIESDWQEAKATIRTKILEKLRQQTEKAKVKLEKEGLLEAYEKEREARLKSKKVVQVKEEEEDQEVTSADLQETPEMKKLFAAEDAANEKIERMLEEGSKPAGKIVQKKRPPLVRKVKSKE